MENQLNIALIHLNVRYKDVKTNCRELVRLNLEAAKNGNKIIVNTEMGISGYSFSSREDIAPYALTDQHDVISQLKAIAKEYSSYICLGFAEKDRESVLFYNSALVIGPVGKIILKYPKINAEAKWACPGDPVQDNVFDTPWAKVGVLICSDTYHGLLPRQTALKGADLIIVPANWPFSGLDPKELWAIRAKENGIYLAACNRGGKDKMMNCDNAPSCVFSPTGEIIAAICSKESKIINLSLPLTLQGKLSGITRSDIMATRNPVNYGPIYLDMRHVSYGGGDLTSYYELAPPATFKVVCHTATKDFDQDMPAQDIPARNMLDKIMAFSDTPLKEFVLLVFPQMTLTEPDKFIAKISDIIKNKNLAICFSTNYGHEQSVSVLISQETGAVISAQSSSGHGPDPKGICIVDTGPARLGLCRPKDLYHPEIGIVYSKLGCDLLVSSMEYIEKGASLIMAGRSLDKICVAIACNNSAMICQPPKGHDRWKDVQAKTPDFCEDRIDIEKIREKSFQDRVDFQTLLSLKLYNNKPE